MEKTVNKLEILTYYGFVEYPHSYIKRISDDWIIRVDKVTKKLKYWDSNNGQVQDATPFIQDLIKAGIIE